MSDFDPAKETKNLQKHRVSLARWVDLDDFAIVPDDRFDYGEPRYRAANLDIARMVISTALLIAWFSLFAMSDTGRSAFDAHMQRK
jgi:uncharacterized DUF497 family protein